jgi:cholesterol oxidase
MPKYINEAPGPLSRSAHELQARLGADGGQGFDCDLLIVGSGYGAAVAAARLGGLLRADGKAAEVWLLERGREYAPGDFPSRFAELPAHVRLGRQDGSAPIGRASGLFDLRLGKDVSVLLGNGLGGGSLINANVMLRPDVSTLEDGWPSALKPAQWEAGFTRAESMLQAQLWQNPPVLGKVRAIDALAELAQGEAAASEVCPITVHWNAPQSGPVALQPCTLCGDCLTGCNQGAKGSLDTNYLVVAAQRGVKMFNGVAVQRLDLADRQDEAEGWNVAWQPTDAPPGSGSPAADGGQTPRPIRARRVVLAAGSLGSTELLMRSRSRDGGGLVLASAQLGAGFSINGDALMSAVDHPDRIGAAADPQADPGAQLDANGQPLPGLRRVGPTINRMLRVPAEGNAKPAFLLQEFAVPGALRRVFGEASLLLNMLRGLQLKASFEGADPAALTDPEIDRMALYGLMGHDSAAGKLELPTRSAQGHEGAVAVRWPDIAKDKVFAHMAHWLERLGKLRDAGENEGSRAAPARLSLLSPRDNLMQRVAKSVKRISNSPVAQALAQMADATPLGTKMRARVQAVLRRVVEALPLPTSWNLLGGGTAGMFITVHPLGGCRMADDGGKGVVNAFGLVFKGSGTETYNSLAVLDGAIIPKALGVNPALTIAAVAEMAVPALVQAFGWKLPDTQAKPPAAQTVRLPGRRRELPPAEAVWLLKERLQGQLSIPAPVGGLAPGAEPQSYWAELDLEYEDIPGFERALQLPQRSVLVRRGTLRLFPWDDHHPATAAYRYPAPQRKAVQTAQLAGSLLLFAPELDTKRAQADATYATLDYRLTVEAVSSAGGDAGQAQAPLRVGQRLDARKSFRPGAKASVSVLRQLSQAELRLDGLSVGRLLLDEGDLAQRGEPLLSLRRQSSAPDALADAIVGGLYVARRAAPRLVQSYLSRAMRSAPRPEGLAKRFPGAVGTLKPEVHFVGTSGARLSRYRPSDGTNAKASQVPLLLLHGMGASGSSYTLEGDAQHTSYVRHALKTRRDVWVLDLRSSIGNEFGRLSAESAQWTAELIATQDIPAAINKVLEEARQHKLDVFGHCMGGLMMWMALLSDPALGKKIHAAVFSQTTPWLVPTAFNRLRGFLATYLLRYLRIEEVGTTPEFALDVSTGGPDHKNAALRWNHDPAAQQANRWVDMLLAEFPYDDDDLAQQAAINASVDRNDAIDWAVRRRADGIFGQLFHLQNVSAGTLRQLDAMLGWVKMNMLAQAIHFARERVLTDAQGRNLWLDDDNLRACLPFPLLIVHGRRNRVFEWEGSATTWKTLTQLRGGNASAPAQSLEQRTPGQHFGAATPTQLLVFDDYGHLDCVIGRNAARDVLTPALAFLAQPPTLDAAARPASSPISVEPPAVGPLMGWVRCGSNPQDGPFYDATFSLRPSAKQAQPRHVAFVPIRWRGGVPMAEVAKAQLLALPAAQGGTLHLTLRLRTSDLQGLAYGFAVLCVGNASVAATAAAGPGAAARGAGAGTAAAATPAAELRLVSAGGRAATLSRPLAVDAACAAALQMRLDAGGVELVNDCQIAFPSRLLDAADRSKGLEEKGEPVSPLSFALGSCQYPPGLADRRPASAAYAALWGDAMRPNGPQFLLQLGDQVYVDDTAGAFEPAAVVASQPSDKANAQRDVAHAYALNFGLVATRRAMGRLPSYPMLDDHEVFDNWTAQVRTDPKRSQQMQEGLEAFKSLQLPRAPSGRLSKAAGCFSYGFRPGGYAFFVLDTRSKRELRTPANAATAQIVPGQTLTALTSALLAIQKAQPDLPKFIACPSPILPIERCALQAEPAARMASDTWSGFSASLDALLRFIRDEQIRHVVLLSGDSHLSSVTTLSFPAQGKRAANRVISIVSSGFYAPWPFANQAPRDVVLEGPVNLAAPGRADLSGQMQLHAMSTTSGYAVVTVLAKGGGQAPGLLKVSLRDGDRRSTDCEFELG